MPRFKYLLNSTCTNRYPATLRILIVMSLLYLSAGPAPAFGADLEAGKLKAIQVCANCHGIDGQSASGGNSAISPKLTPQNRSFLANKLNEYRNGKIEHPQMSLIARMITEEDIENISAWYGTMRPEAVLFSEKHGMNGQDNEPAVELKNGKQKVSAMCVACHGLDGMAVSEAGKQHIPNLAGQLKDYMVLRLKEYRDGRIDHPIMRSIAKTLSDQDIEDVSLWYSGIDVRFGEIQ